MDELEVLKSKILKFLKEYGPTHVFFLAEKIGCPNNTKFYRGKVNKAVIALFEEGRIKVEDIVSWGPEEILKVAIISLKKEP